MAGWRWGEVRRREGLVKVPWIMWQVQEVREGLRERVRGRQGAGCRPCKTWLCPV